jgi:uncharacterized protein YgfB (UPF0149 family)
MLDYTIAKEAFEKFSSTDTMASAHGILCGYACVNVDITLENWLYEVLEEYSPDDDFSVLASIFNTTLEELSDPELNFHLLIDEDNGLTIMAIDIKDWCNGFLTGLGLTQVQTGDEEIVEILESISHIASLDSSITETVENSNDLMEIVEFVRMSVLLVQENLNPSKQDFVNPIALH